MGWDTLLLSSSPRSVLGLVSVLLQEKDCVASIWRLCEAAVMTAREAPSSAPKVNESLGPTLPWDQLCPAAPVKSQQLQSLKHREVDSRVSPLVVPGLNEGQQVEIILAQQNLVCSLHS